MPDEHPVESYGKLESWHRPLTPLRRAPLVHFSKAAIAGELNDDLTVRAQPLCLGIEATHYARRHVRADTLGNLIAVRMVQRGHIEVRGVSIVGVKPKFVFASGLSS